MKRPLDELQLVNLLLSDANRERIEQIFWKYFRTRHASPVLLRLGCVHECELCPFLHWTLLSNVQIIGLVFRLTLAFDSRMSRLCDVPLQIWADEIKVWGPDSTIELQTYGKLRWFSFYLILSIYNKNNTHNSKNGRENLLR